jgi:hypothetical protein
LAWWQKKQQHKSAQSDPIVSVASVERDLNAQMAKDLSVIANGQGAMKATAHQGADLKQAKEVRNVVDLEVALVVLAVLCGCSR